MTRGGPDRIVLVGMMGSGKTTVGRLLAERLTWPFYDNDAMLRQLFDATPRDLLAAGGEEAMHAAEVSVLRTALAMPPPLVVAAAGGAILDPEARAELADCGLVVWLRVTGQTVERRSVAGAHRPWPDDDHARWIAEAMETRESLYREVTDLVLDADALTPQALADQILDELEEPPAPT